MQALLGSLPESVQLFLSLASLFLFPLLLISVWIFALWTVGKPKGHTRDTRVIFKPALLVTQYHHFFSAFFGFSSVFRLLNLIFKARVYQISVDRTLYPLPCIEFQWFVGGLPVCPRLEMFLPAVLLKPFLPKAEVDRLTIRTDGWFSSYVGLLFGKGQFDGEFHLELPLLIEVKAEFPIVNGTLNVSGILAPNTRFQQIATRGPFKDLEIEMPQIQLREGDLCISYVSSVYYTEVSLKLRFEIFSCQSFLEGDTIRTLFSAWSFGIPEGRLVLGNTTHVCRDLKMRSIKGGLLLSSFNYSGFLEIGELAAQLHTQIKLEDFPELGIWKNEDGTSGIHMKATLHLSGRMELGISREGDEQNGWIPPAADEPRQRLVHPRKILKLLEPSNFKTWYLRIQDLRPRLLDMRLVYDQLNHNQWTDFSFSMKEIGFKVSARSAYPQIFFDVNWDQALDPKICRCRSSSSFAIDFPTSGHVYGELDALSGEGHCEAESLKGRFKTVTLVHHLIRVIMNGSKDTLASLADYVALDCEGSFKDVLSFLANCPHALENSFDRYTAFREVLKENQIYAGKDTLKLLDHQALALLCREALEAVYERPRGALVQFEPRILGFLDSFSRANGVMALDIFSGIWEFFQFLGMDEGFTSRYKDFFFLAAMMENFGSPVDIPAVQLALEDHWPVACLQSPGKPPAAHQLEKLFQLKDELEVIRFLELQQMGSLDEVLAWVPRLPVYLTIYQCEYISSIIDASFFRQFKEAFDQAARVKRQVSDLNQAHAEAYGFAVGFSVTSLVNLLAPQFNTKVPWDSWEYMTAEPLLPLACSDLAVILKVVLTSALNPSRVDVTNFMLIIDFLKEANEPYLVSCLSRLAFPSVEPRPLANLLINLFNFSVQCFKTPPDIVSILQANLSLEIPCRKDYIVGGPLASSRYLEVMYEFAAALLKQAQPQASLLDRIRHYREDPPRELGDTDSVFHSNFPERLKEMDRQAAEWDLENPDQRLALIQGYQEILASLRRDLSLYPTLFVETEVRTFYRRNLDALIVYHGWRSFRENLDGVRSWLGVAPTTDGDLVRALIPKLFFQYDHLIDDPFMYLLMGEPESHKYDFLLLSGMGIVSEGSNGIELEGSFTRLFERRGVRHLRGHTATSRDLHHNAELLFSALSTFFAENGQCDWGYLGYSQGCANLLILETLLARRSPAQRQLLETLKCRIFLYSAANGSPHADAMRLKNEKGLLLFEDYGKDKAGRLSGKGFNVLLQGVTGTLSLSSVTAILGGMHSLTQEGVKHLWRNGIFKPGVPSISLRAVVDDSCLPEILQTLSRNMDKQGEKAGLAHPTDHDSQVYAEDAKGYSQIYENPQTQNLKRWAVDNSVLRTHHWAPLKPEVEIFETKSDKARRVYDFPKDVHVFPFVEVNARFGFICLQKN